MHVWFKKQNTKKTVKIDVYHPWISKVSFQGWGFFLFFFFCFAGEILICVFTDYLAASNHSGNKSDGD